jgi:hypothetical protein
MADKKKLLITVGPQGSGNHIFSRVFSMHPDVKGWEELKTHYWVKHAREPFVEYFMFPQLLKEEHFNSHQYFTANTSYPLNFDGVRYTPKILEFAEKVRSWNIDVTIAVITRDESIVRAQQQRLRNTETVDSAKQYFIETLLPSGIPLHFLSTEAFFSYKESYLEYLEKILDFPVAYRHPDVLKFITESPNAKYIKPIDSHWLDGENQIGHTPSELTSVKFGRL